MVRGYNISSESLTSQFEAAMIDDQPGLGWFWHQFCEWFASVTKRKNTFNLKYVDVGKDLMSSIASTWQRCALLLNYTTFQNYLELLFLFLFLLFKLNSCWESIYGGSQTTNQFTVQTWGRSALCWCWELF